MVRGHHIVCSGRGGRSDLISPGLDVSELEGSGVLDRELGLVLVGTGDLGDKTSNKEFVIALLEVLAVGVLESDLVLGLRIGGGILDLALSNAGFLVGRDDVREDERLVVLISKDLVELISILIGEVGGPPDLLILIRGLLAVDVEEDDGGGESELFDLRSTVTTTDQTSGEINAEEVESGLNLSRDDGRLDEVSEEILLDERLDKLLREFVSTTFSIDGGSITFSRNGGVGLSSLFALLRRSSGLLRPLKLLEGTSDVSKGGIESIKNLLLVILAPTGRLIGINTGLGPKVETLEAIEESGGGSLEDILITPGLLLGIERFEGSIGETLVATTEVSANELIERMERIQGLVVAGLVSIRNRVVISTESSLSGFIS